MNKPAPEEAPFNPLEGTTIGQWGIYCLCCYGINGLLLKWFMARWIRISSNGTYDTDSFIIAMAFMLSPVTLWIELIIMLLYFVCKFVGQFLISLGGAF